MERNKQPKILIGEIVSDKMAKTSVVLVRRYTKAPKYGKYVKISKRFKAHNENGEFHIGDRVEIQETKPISKGKRWKIVMLLERKAVADF